ncbi:CusA/CzcA family heavy metal efflux RND transporter [Tautonia sp. JC769]|uniref:efflux RND transporter permease subunit n=1 Tax=Tautonia sp. JC769 TaxID=3232135 RepID=UPI00345B0104
MVDGLIRYALTSRGVVLLLTVVLIASGVWCALNLRMDAQPDITPPLVSVLTDAPALSPEEIEQFVTIPVENGLNAIPKIDSIRSISQQGLSVVRIIFERGTDIYWARAQVSQQLEQIRAEIPEGFGTPAMGPITTGLGEIIQFEVKNAPGSDTPKSLMELRTILDWEVALPLRGVPGVIGVNSFGGELKTYRAEVSPDRMLARSIPMDRLFEALGANNANAGGGYIQRNGEVRIIRGEGLIRGTEDMDRIVLDSTEDGTPIFLRDIGRSITAPMLRKGAVTRDGEGESVTAIVYMLIGSNTRLVVDRVEERLEAIRQDLEPLGVEIDVYYNRGSLIETTLHTVAENLVVGGALVIAVLLVLLGNWRAALITAAVIPLAMLGAVDAMYLYGIAGSLLSLGAIDFGLIVDSAVIVIENIVRRLSHAEEGDSKLDVVYEATREVKTPVLYGVGIITMVNLPILALQGVEGAMFRPMALTLIFALSGSMLLALTAVPVAASFFLKMGTGEKETWLIRQAKRLYRPMLPVFLDHPWAVIAAFVAALALSIPPALSMGGEFIPQLDEGDLVIIMSRPPSASLEEGIEQSTRLEQELLSRFPDEIETIVSRTGRPEIGLDPAPLNRTDTFIFLSDYEEWTAVEDKDALVDELEEICDYLMPGTKLNFSQPIELRFNELISGVRADVGIALFGDDLDELSRKAAEMVEVLKTVDGAADVKAQPIRGLPYLRVLVDRDQVARYGINVEDVLDAVRAMGGYTVGQVVVDQRRFDLQVRYEPEDRSDLEAIGAIRIADPRGRMLPLGDLCEIRMEDGVYEIRRLNRERRALVQCNVRGRDLASFVAAGKRAFDEQIDLPEGYRIDWGGTYENLRSAVRRMTIVLPLSLILIFLLLYATFGSMKLGLLIFLSVPFASIGGIFLLFARGIDFSISAGIGFIALAGVSVLDGLVLVSAIRDRLTEKGEDVREAVFEASMERLRPILMTGLVASLGFVPMAFNTGIGAEVQRPLATVVVGGIITSTLMKLILLPAIYHWFDPGVGHRGEAGGVEHPAG